MSPTFVTLPLEIRNEIYSHVFDYTVIMPDGKANGKRLLWRRPGDSSFFCEGYYPNCFLALLEVSHQVLNEAATCFYSNTRFCGDWHQIAAFVKGIGARRRELIRSVEINHRASTVFRFDQDDTLELLGALPRLRTVCITASVPDFARLRDQLIQSGIWEIDDTLLPFPGERWRDKYYFSFAEDRGQWTGANFKRTLLPEFSGESGRLRS